MKREIPNREKWWPRRTKWWWPGGGRENAHGAWVLGRERDGGKKEKVDAGALGVKLGKWGKRHRHYLREEGARKAEGERRRYKVIIFFLKELEDWINVTGLIGTNEGSCKIWIFSETIMWVVRFCAAMFSCSGVGKRKDSRAHAGLMQGFM